MSDPVTQVEDPVVDVNEGGADDGSGGSNEPFLPVNDRTIYKTREDAIKGFTEAQNRITSLSGYEKVLKKYGAANANPEMLETIVTEYLKLRDVAKKGANGTDSTKATTSDATKVDPKTAEAVKWLKEQGFISKDEAKALKDEIDALKNGMSAKETESRDALISDGQEAVTGWLKGAKGADGKSLEISDDQREELESTIAAWVNANPSRIEKFYRGGQTTQALIKEGYTKALPLVIDGAVAFPNPATKTVSSAKTKTELIRNAGKRMPNDGGAADGKDAKPMKLGNPKLFKQATEHLKARLAELNGGGE